MKLYTGVASAFGVKVELAAIEKGLALDVELVPFSIGDGYEPKHPEVLRLNPKGQVPVLVDGDLTLYDSTQIMEYFEDLRPDPALWPRGAQARAAARLQELQIDEVFFPHVVALFPKNRAAGSEARAQEAVKAIAEHYAAWDRQLAETGGPFLRGEISYVDVALLPTQFMAEALGVPIGAELRHLSAWRARMLARASARGVARSYAFAKGLGLVLPAYEVLGAA